jgi:hypothetical protein
VPVVTLYDRFTTQSGVLQQKGTAIGQANMEQGQQRQWMVPDLGSGSFTIPGLAKAFDRTEMGNGYATAFTSPQGSAGDAMAAKLQSDYLASQERAYRCRKNGKVRCGLHAATRRTAHGAKNGVFGRVSSYVQDVIQAGSAGFLPRSS